MASRAETTRDQWKTAFALITVANGYTNALSAAQVSKGMVDPAMVVTFPHIVLELGDSVIEPQTDDWNLFDEDVELYITGFVKANEETQAFAAGDKLEDAMESLVHDLKKKICTDLIDVNMTDGTNPWNARLIRQKLRFSRVSGIGLPKNVGRVGSKLTLQIRNQTSTFA